MERYSKIKRFKEMCLYFSQRSQQYKQRKAISNQKVNIICALIEKGITQKSIAERVNVSPQTVGNVIAGKARSHKIECVITELTGFKFPANQRVTRERVAQI